MENNKLSISYKAKYQKYKTKYIELKKSLMNIQYGGSFTYANTAHNYFVFAMILKYINEPQQKTISTMIQNYMKPSSSDNIETNFLKDIRVDNLKKVIGIFTKNTDKPEEKKIDAIYKALQIHQNDKTPLIYLLLKNVFTNYESYRNENTHEEYIEFFYKIYNTSIYSILLSAERYLEIKNFIHHQTIKPIHYKWYSILYHTHRRLSKQLVIQKRLRTRTRTGTMNVKT